MLTDIGLKIVALAFNQFHQISGVILVVCVNDELAPAAFQRIKAGPVHKLRAQHSPMIFGFISILRVEVPQRGLRKI